MAIFLTVLKWIGIILLILLAIVLLLLLLLLFVPFRYRGRAQINDPECHEEFPVSVIRENSDVLFDVSWLLGIVKMVVAFPGKRLLSLRVFGKEVWYKEMGQKSDQKEEKKEEPEEEKEEDQRSLSEKIEAAGAKVEKYTGVADYVYRVLTGRCGRRAWSKVQKRLINILCHVGANSWRLTGNIGLNDPNLNGKMNMIYGMLMPFADEHLDLETQWDLYRCDLEAEASGQVRIIVPVKEAVPLVFDKDCRKVFKKLLKVKAKLQ